LKILVSALEASANLHLKHILSHLENIKLFGIFDHNLGDKPLHSSKEFGVMGFVDILKVYKKAKNALKIMAKEATNYKLALLIDSPAFNIPLARAIKKQSPDTKIIYYILPQVWAWKKQRVKILEDLADYLFAILPFEEKFWNKAKYIGNPLAEEIKLFKNELTQTNTTAFLPGSRKSEIKKLMPIFRDFAKKIGGKKLLVVPPFLAQDLEDIYGDTQDFEISKNTEEALFNSEKAIVCSGTASLEATLIGTPLVIVYKAKWIDYFIAKFFIKLPFIGLANVIRFFQKKEPIVTELLQNNVNTHKIQTTLNEMDKKEFLTKALELRQDLRKSKPSLEVAKTISKILKADKTQSIKSKE